MCEFHLHSPDPDAVIRFVDHSDGTTSILIDSEEFGTVISATVFTVELIERYTRGG